MRKQKDGKPYDCIYIHTGIFKEKGITLIALVVTIVVLLILAGVSLNLVVGNNGIISKAKEARDKSAEATENDLKGMNGLAQLIEDTLGDGGNGGGSGGSGSDTKVPAEPTDETAPYFPDNTFTKKEGSIDEGLVIQDASGNEYVWVVVPKSLYNNTAYNSNNEKKPSSSTDYANIEYCLTQYTTTYGKTTSYLLDEWYDDKENVGWLTADEYTKLKNKMLRSVYENGGFYVGRYEAGIAENRTSKSATNSDGKYTIEGMPTPLSKADEYPYTYVTRTQAQNLANNVNSGSKTSSLMFGAQWDLVLAFMSKDTAKVTDTTILTSNSMTIGNYYNSTFDLNRGKYAQYGQLENPWNNFNSELGSIVVSNEETGKMKKKEQYSKSKGILLTTGGTEQSKVMNIYDIAGNVWEWTLGKGIGFDGNCAGKGGSFYDTGYQPADNTIGNGSTDGSCDEIGFRISIF